MPVTAHEGFSTGSEHADTMSIQSLSESFLLGGEQRLANELKCLTACSSAPDHRTAVPWQTESPGFRHESTPGAATTRLAARSPILG
jgi:hypothetical protein